MSFIDATSRVRQGEELDPRRIAEFIKQNVESLKGDLAIEQFTSGASNRTYLIRIGSDELVLRCPPFGSENIKAGHDMHREFRVLSKLHKVYPPTPRPIIYCDDQSIVGAPFYLMERKKGVILRKDLPDKLNISPEMMKRLCASLIDNLVEIHNLDWVSLELNEIGKPEGFLARQLEGWVQRYDRVQTDEIPEVAAVTEWLRDNQPQSPGATLIHNDYKFDNVVLDPDDLTRIIGVLDWEMSTIGDPLLDLGVTLGYWIGKNDPELLQLARTQPTNLPGSFSRSELAESYAKKTGRDISNIVFYFAFALFKLAVIAQQIYYRYAKGYIKDPLFSLMQAGTMIFVRHSALAIEKGSIDF
ncbi:MAG: phosphotransferase family protein [Deltaproteobacteria bacterium]|nr:phosphotransferase family protein [Deltaproteobacteria bacterium]